MKTQVLTVSDGCSRAVELLQAGDVVGLPTETVYGLGAAALNSLACAKIFEVKDRPLSDPLIVHLPDKEDLRALARPNALAMQLAEAFWPGPFTMILPRRKVVPDLVTAGSDSVALRMSAHPGFQSVALAFGSPIAAPSANRFGRISPTCAADVVRELGGRIPLVLDDGPCRHGLESTIVRLRDDGLEILRHGPVTQDQLAEFGKILVPREAMAVPGGMKSHYAPRTPLEILPIAGRPSGSGSGEGDLSRSGLLAWTLDGEGFAVVERLSETQDLREAAAGLFRAMRRLDDAGLDRIFAEPVPEHGLGVAIMDRLRKAAA